MQKLHVYFRIILEDIKKVSCFSIDMYKKKKKKSQKRTWLLLQIMLNDAIADGIKFIHYHL
jgi:hypothetical protein